MKKKIFLFVFLLPFLLFSQNQTVGLFQYDSTSYDGYTLFSPDEGTYLIDNCGKLVHSWQSTYKPGLSVYLLEDGSLLRACRIQNTVFSGGGSGGNSNKRLLKGWIYGHCFPLLQSSPNQHFIVLLELDEVKVGCWNQQVLLCGHLSPSLHFPGFDPGPFALHA